MRFPSPRFLLVPLLVLLTAAPVAADDLPTQLLFPPLPAAPLDATAPAPVELGLHVYHLPDARRAESYRLSSWFRFGPHHALRASVSYAGIESSELVQYGGGPADLQWTWNLQGFDRPGVALDVKGVAPVGDPALHPLSARAPSIHLRVRANLAASTRGRVWLGWATRRVSPPEERNQPLASFPSGSGVEFGAELRRGPGAIALTVRHDLAGLPQHTFGELALRWIPESRMALVAGATLDLGPDRNRLMDLGWRVGLQWFRPPPPPTP